MPEGGRTGPFAALVCRRTESAEPRVECETGPILVRPSVWTEQKGHNGDPSVLQFLHERYVGAFAGRQHQECGQVSLLVEAAQETAEMILRTRDAVHLVHMHDFDS